ncbi:MAG: glycosyltransferase [Bacteroidetes bacterium]|nr:glycosyltransferase [Bacteroidota bacterium]
MKVLWFANTPCGATEKLIPDHYLGGWLKSLEQQLVLNNDIELTVCFYWEEAVEPFRYKNTMYYPVFRPGRNSKTERLINRILRSDNDKKETGELVKIVKMVRPDIIHIHGTEHNYGLIQAHTDIPVVISIQGLLSPFSEMYFSGVSFRAAYRFEGIKPKLLFRSYSRTIAELKKRATKEREILSHALFITGRTNWDRRITGLLSPSSQYFTCNEMLRPAFYQFLWHKSRFNTPLQIVTIMNSDLSKGLETVIKSAEILCKQNSVPFKWIIIGLKETDELPMMLKRWLKIDYQSLNISFYGLKSETDVVEILVKSDIYCQVSHLENSSNSLCEAMLIGMPVIASFAGGTDTILENNKEGILFQNGDAYSLAGSITELSKNFEKAVKYGTNARETALKRHNPDEIVRKQIEIYHTVIQVAEKK